MSSKARPRRTPSRRCTDSPPATTRSARTGDTDPRRAAPMPAFAFPRFSVVSASKARSFRGPPAMAIKHPYLLFLGDAHDQLAAKTADGVAFWRSEWCLGQFRLPGCKADLKLPDMSVQAAAAAGAKTLVLGVANPGGVGAERWTPLLTLSLH